MGTHGNPWEWMGRKKSVGGWVIQGIAWIMWLDIAWDRFPHLSAWYAAFRGAVYDISQGKPGQVSLCVPLTVNICQPHQSRTGAEKDRGLPGYLRAIYLYQLSFMSVLEIEKRSIQTYLSSNSTLSKI